MQDQNLRPKVGMGILVFKDGKLLVGKRVGNYAGEMYGIVGGHLEYMESFADCAKREAMEEAGIEIENIRFLCLSNFKDFAPKHYVDIGVIADWKSGEPKICEPDKIIDWQWCDIKNLPHPFFPAIRYYLEALDTNKIFFDS